MTRHLGSYTAGCNRTTTPATLLSRSLPTKHRTITPVTTISTEWAAQARATRHVPFILAGPGIVSGQTYTQDMGVDDMSANYMYALSLPTPVDSRGQVILQFLYHGWYANTYTYANEDGDSFAFTDQQPDRDANTGAHSSADRYLHSSADCYFHSTNCDTYGNQHLHASSKPRPYPEWRL